MRKLMMLAALAAALMAFPVRGADLEQVQTGSLTATATCPAGVMAYSYGAATFGISVTGTWVATLAFKATIDGTTWVDAPAYPSDGGKVVSAATANGRWFVNAAGYRAVCVGVSAFTSGTIVATIVGSSADAGPVPKAFAPSAPGAFKCYVAASTATTIQAVGGDCATPGAGYSLYVTDISFSSSAASGTAADSFPTLKSGTGGTCGTATAVVWGALSAANTTVTDNRTTPLKLTATHELCWIHSTAGTKVLVIGGFIAP